ncbi:MAG: hypothetical protein KAY04_06550 [Burkholderiales bacterium]|nr:hypothetical protein [Burkholderiales bacterium]
MQPDLPATAGDCRDGSTGGATRQPALENALFSAFPNQPPATCGNMGMLTFHLTRTDHESA